MMGTPLDKKGLLPCPFCGEAPEVRGSVIGCKNTNCWGPSIWHMANIEDSATAWNRRALSAVALPDELEGRLRERSGFMRSAGHDDDADLDEEAADALSQAHSTIAALRAEIEQSWAALGRTEIEGQTLTGRIMQERVRTVNELVAAEAEVKRLTEEKEALRVERDAALSLMETALLSADPHRHIRAARQALSGSKE